jgi:hypothetical protein
MIKASLPHPEGMIKITLERKGKSGIRGKVVLPGDLEGEFIWNKNRVELKGGGQDVQLD